MIKLHLHKSGAGFSSKTACGRNILRTHLSVGWAGFKAAAHRCERCESSKQFELNARGDEKAARAEPAKVIRESILSLIANPATPPEQVILLAEILAANPA